MKNLRFKVGDNVVEVPKEPPLEIKRFFIANSRKVDEEEIAPDLYTFSFDCLLNDKIDEMIELIFGKEAFDYWAEHQTDVAPHLRVVFKAWGFNIKVYAYYLN